VPVFAFSPAVRRIIDTTNAIESLHRQLRKALRNKEHFPRHKAARKLISLALTQAQAKGKRPPGAWQQAKAQFAIQFGDCFQVAA
jgi:transposase-like protein